MALRFQLPSVSTLGLTTNDLLLGGKLNFYVTGTSTRLDTYSDDTMVTANTNPVVLDANGRHGDIFLKAQSYKVVLTTSADAVIKTMDPVHGGASISGTTLTSLTNIAAMTALLKASLTDGIQVLVSGYATVNDGGGGVFYWHLGSSTTADSGTVFAADEGGTGRWKRVFSGAVNARWFGAKGDNSTNDTVAIQAAINLVYTSNLGEVFVPAGTYLVTNLTCTFVASAPFETVNIVGSGKQSTIFKKHGAGTDPIFSWLSSGSAAESYSDFRDFSIVGTSALFHGIRITAVARFTIENVDIRLCNRAIDNVGALVWTGRRLTLSGNTYGLFTSLGAAYSNLIQIEDSEIVGNTTAGCDLGSGMDIQITGVDFEFNGTAANAATGAIIIRDTVDNESGFAGMSIKDCWFEQGNGWDIRVESTSGLILTIEDCHSLASEAGQALKVDGCRSFILDNFWAATAGDTVNVGSGVNNFSMRGGIVGTLTNTAQQSLIIGVTQGAAVLSNSLNVYATDVAFTPLLEGTTAAGAGTYSAQLGRYSVIGNQVFFRVSLTWSAHTGTGNMRVNLNDIPYTSRTTDIAFLVTVLFENLTFTGVPAAQLAANGSKIVTLYVLATGVGAAAVAMDTAGGLVLSGWFDRAP